MLVHWQTPAGHDKIAPPKKQRSKRSTVSHAIFKPLVRTRLGSALVGPSCLSFAINKLTGRLVKLLEGCRLGCHAKSKFGRGRSLCCRLTHFVGLPS